MNRSLKLWAVRSTACVEPVSPLKQMETELELENILVANPELLEPNLRLVGRQTPASDGWLDLLAVDADGRLVIYELKRGRLGRDAVTQALDYASALDDMGLTELSQHIASRSGIGGIECIDDFESWYLDNFGDDLSRLLPRMVLVGLGMDEATERMDDLREWMPSSGKFEDTYRTGVSFHFNEIDDFGKRVSKQYFGVYAAYPTPNTIHISIRVKS